MDSFQRAAADKALAGSAATAAQALADVTYSGHHKIIGGTLVMWLDAAKAVRAAHFTGDPETSDDAVVRHMARRLVAALTVLLVKSGAVKNFEITFDWNRKVPVLATWSGLREGIGIALPEGN